MDKKDKTIKITLQPIGREVTVAEGTPLRDLLFEQGVEFPCGGNGRCRGCKVRILSGRADVNDAQREHLSDAEIAAGWRLSCQCRAQDNITLELRQWDASILSDDAAFTFTPQEGLGVAIDLGTTTLVAQLLDLQTGGVLAVRTALNAQARHGGDVMSRIQFAVAENGQTTLETAIREQIHGLVRQLLRAAEQGEGNAAGKPVTRIVLVGNTVMHHLFCGIDATPLSRYPFEPEDSGMKVFAATALGWDDLPGDPEVRFLPNMGSFVGSDLLAGVLATGLNKTHDLTCLIDLGTNGEIVLGNAERILCASTAAGPAFEGARIAMGMRAATGAIWKVTPENEEFAVEVLGNVPPRGICGSGLVDAVAAGLELGRIKPTGRLSQPGDLIIAEPVSLTQTDIRQLQLAKGAIAAGVRLLVKEWGAEMEDVTRVYLAGAFGNYVNRASAERIGLIAFPEEKVTPSGNTALLGAKIALCTPDTADTFTAVIRRSRHVPLNEDPAFQDIYVEEMSFS